MSKNMNSEKELVSIIILNYNGNEFLENCIESIFRETKQKFELIIVDNNSSDKSGEKFSKKYESCKFILNKKNVGVSEGLNIGIRNANGKHIVLLNNDLIVAPKWLDYLFEAYKEKGNALYQPKFLKMKNRNIIPKRKECGDGKNFGGLKSPSIFFFIIVIFFSMQKFLWVTPT